MDTYKLKFTTLQNEIFRLLCIRAGESLNQSAIARLLKVSPTAVAKALPILEKEGFIKLEKHKEMNLNSVQLCRSQEIMRLKRAENLRLVYETGLADALEENFPGTAIILFGSFSRGDDTAKSDIDIAIMGSGKTKDIDLSAYETRLEKKININNYASAKDVHKELMENLCNGIVLAGGIEL